MLMRAGLVPAPTAQLFLLSCVGRLALCLFMPAVRAPPVRGFALGGRVVNRFGHATRDHLFLMAQFVPAAQTAFAATRARGLELIVCHKTSEAVPAVLIQFENKSRSAVISLSFSLA